MKLKKKQVVGIILTLIIVLLILVGIIYAKTDLFRSPKQLFYKYLAQNSEIVGKLDYDKALQQYQEMSQKSVTATGDISLEMNSQNAQLSQIADSIKNAKINYTVKKLPEENKIYGDIRLNYQNQEVLKMELLQNDSIYGLKLDEVYDKYLAVKNENLKQLAQKLGMPSDQIPNQFEQVDVYDLLYISKEDRNQIIKTYIQVLDEMIPNDKYIANNKKQILVDGESVEAKSYTLSLTEKETYEIMVRLLETLKSDDFTLDMIVNKIDKATVNDLIEENTKITKGKLQEAIQEQIDSLRWELETASATDTMNITVYANNNKVVKTEITVQDGIITLDKIEVDKNANKVILTITEDGQELSKMTLDNKKEENNDEVSNNINLTIEQNGQTIKLGCFVNNKGTVSSGNVNTNMNITIESKELSFTVKINENDNYKEVPQIDTMNETNMSQLNDMEVSQINDLMSRISNKITEILPQKMNMLGIQM